MSREPAPYTVVRKEIVSIKDQASQLDLETGGQLESDLFRLEMKINALRSFIWNHLIRDELKKKQQTKKSGREKGVSQAKGKFQ